MKKHILILRVLAILLIVNEHLDKIYPYSAMSVGGYLGISIFFFVSGWGLAHSYEANPVGMSIWFKKRFVKLIIPLTIICLAVNLFSIDRFLGTLVGHLVPHSFSQLDSFLPNLVVLYLFSFMLLQFSSKKLLNFLIILCIIPIFLNLFPVIDKEKFDIFYPVNAFACFISGIIASRRVPIFCFYDIIGKRSVYFGLLALLFLHIYVKVIGIELLLFYITIIETIFLFNFMYIISQYINNETFLNIVKSVAMSSLAVYLVHFKIIYAFVALDMQGFSVAFYVFSISVAVSIPLAQASNWVTAKLNFDFAA